MEYNLSKLVQDAAIKIEAEKERLLFQRCVERIKTNEAIDFTKEAKKRFPRIKMELNSNDNSVHYYWNDGSDEGLHLISFYSVDIDCDLLTKDSDLKIGFKYH